MQIRLLLAVLKPRNGKKPRRKWPAAKHARGSECLFVIDHNTKHQRFQGVPFVAKPKAALK